MRIVVTGATSMIGTALINECIRNHCEVLAIVRNGTRRLDRLQKSDLICIEYADLDCLDCVNGNGKTWDVFYHFAWGHTNKNERDNPIAQEDNIKTTLQAVELAHRLGCKRFIGAGSQAEYGRINGVISADTHANPITAYGISKYAANMLSRRYCEQLGMKHIWGRIFSVYGINDNENTMLNYAIDQFIEGKTAEFSSATQMWNYLYETDAGMFFYLLGVKDVESGIYCIANSQSRVLREYIEELQTAYGESAKCSFTRPSADVYSLQADIEKTIQATGYKPKTGFDEGIRKVIVARRGRAK